MVYKRKFFQSISRSALVSAMALICGMQEPLWAGEPCTPDKGKAPARLRMKEADVKKSQAGWSSLPVELLREIAEKLEGPAETAALAQVDRRSHAVVEDKRKADINGFLWNHALLKSSSQTPLPKSLMGLPPEHLRRLVNEKFKEIKVLVARSGSALDKLLYDIDAFAPQEARGDAPGPVEDPENHFTERSVYEYALAQDDKFKQALCTHPSLEALPEDLKMAAIQNACGSFCLYGATEDLNAKSTDIQKLIEASLFERTYISLSDPKFDEKVAKLHGQPADIIMAQEEFNDAAHAKITEVFDREGHQFTLVFDVREESFSMVCAGQRYVLPPEVTSLAFTNSNNRLKRIKHSFLANCHSLQHLDLSSLRNVTYIEGYFLANMDIKELDLSSLRNVTHIEDWFLDRTIYDLEHLDLSSLRKVTSIEPGFLSGSEYLQTFRVSKALLALFPEIGKKYPGSVRVHQEHKTSQDK